MEDVSISARTKSRRGIIIAAFLAALLISAVAVALAWANNPQGKTTAKQRIVPASNDPGFRQLKLGPGEGCIVREGGIGVAKPGRAARRTLACILRPALGLPARRRGEPGAGGVRRSGGPAGRCGLAPPGGARSPRSTTRWCARSMRSPPPSPIANGNGTRASHGLRSRHRRLDRQPAAQRDALGEGDPRGRQFHPGQWRRSGDLRQPRLRRPEARDCRTPPRRAGIPACRTTTTTSRGRIRSSMTPISRPASGALAELHRHDGRAPEGVRRPTGSTSPATWRSATTTRWCRETRPPTSHRAGGHRVHKAAHRLGRHEHRRRARKSLAGRPCRRWRPIDRMLVPPDPGSPVRHPSSSTRRCSSAAARPTGTASTSSTRRRTRASGGAAGYYSWSPVPRVRFIALDTICEGGIAGPSADGNIDDPAVPVAEGQAAGSAGGRPARRPVQPPAIQSLTCNVPDEAAPPCTGRRRARARRQPGLRRRPAQLHADPPRRRRSPRCCTGIRTRSRGSPATSHVNDVTPYPDGKGGGGFWMIRTAAEADWPQQSRLIQVFDNHDGTPFDLRHDPRPREQRPRRRPPSSSLTSPDPFELASIGRTLSLQRPPGGRPRVLAQPVRRGRRRRTATSSCWSEPPHPLTDSRGHVERRPGRFQAGINCAPPMQVPTRLWRALPRARTAIPADLRRVARTLRSLRGSDPVTGLSSLPTRAGRGPAPRRRDPRMRRDDGSSGRQGRLGDCGDGHRRRGDEGLASLAR